MGTSGTTRTSQICYLGCFSSLGSELAPRDLPGRFLCHFLNFKSLSGAFWGHFLAWAHKSLQETPLGLSGSISALGPGVASGGFFGNIWDYLLG
eukprot:1698583-Karenia_brevis.AAC.1